MKKVVKTLTLEIDETKAKKVKTQDMVNKEYELKSEKATKVKKGIHKMMKHANADPLELRERMVTYGVPAKDANLTTANMLTEYVKIDDVLKAVLRSEGGLDKHMQSTLPMDAVIERKRVTIALPKYIWNVLKGNTTDAPREDGKFALSTLLFALTECMDAHTSTFSLINHLSGPKRRKEAELVKNREYVSKKGTSN